MTVFCGVTLSPENVVMIYFMTASPPVTFQPVYLMQVLTQLMESFTELVLSIQLQINRSQILLGHRQLQIS